MKKATYFKILSILPVWSFIFLAGLNAQYIRVDSAMTSEVDEVIDAIISQNNLVGAAVGMIKDGEVVFLKGYGYADSANLVEADECTWFRIGSTSKLLTAVLIMQLMEEGKIDLSDDVRKYVPEFGEHPDTIASIDRVLSHRAGLEEYVFGFESFFTEQLSYNAIRSVNLFANYPLRNSVPYPVPKLNGFYSNIGYNLLGAVAERAGNEPFEYMVLNRIIKPLHLPTLMPEYKWRSISSRSNYYNVAANPPVEIFPVYGSNIVNLPSGGYGGSAVDLTLLAKGIIDRNLVSQTTLDTMCRHLSNLTNRENRMYGYSIFSETANRSNTNFYIGGGLDGGSSYIYFSHDFSDAIIIVANAITTMYPAEDASKILLPILENATILPGNDYIPGPLPTTNLVVNSMPEEDYTGIANNVESAVTLNSQNELILQGDAITLKPGFHAISGSSFLAHSGNANNQCMEQPNQIGFKTQPDTAPTPDSFNLFPNPGEGRFTIRSSNEIASVSIFGLQGNLVKEASGIFQNEVQINLQDLSAGSYFVKTQMTNGNLETRKYMLTR